MKCLRPILIKTPEKMMKQFWRWPDNHPLSHIYVPCGHCLPCYHMRRLNWVIRMDKELEVSNSCYFVTLTYDDEHLPRTQSGFPTISKREHQLFMKRLRKLYPGENIRFFMCGEYGDNFDRPHYHYVLFNLPWSVMDDAQLVNSHAGIYLSPTLQKVWQRGFVEIGKITPGGMSYVAKYVQWREESDSGRFHPEQQKPFGLMSRNPAIGANYLEKDWNQSFLYHDGRRVPTPRYYRDKMELEEDFVIDLPDVIDYSVREYKNAQFNEKSYFNAKRKEKQLFNEQLSRNNQDSTY